MINATSQTGAARPVWSSWIPATALLAAQLPTFTSSEEFEWCNRVD